MQSEEPEAGQYLRGDFDQVDGDPDSVSGLGGAGSVGWVQRVLQLIASPSKRTERPQDGPELSPDELLARPRSDPDVVGRRPYWTSRAVHAWRAASWASTKALSGLVCSMARAAAMVCLARSSHGEPSA
jgi:hypothetical protein